MPRGGVARRRPTSPVAHATGEPWAAPSLFTAPRALLSLSTQHRDHNPSYYSPGNAPPLTPYTHRQPQQNAPRRESCPAH
jgi:hypothetical protein